MEDRIYVDKNYICESCGTIFNQDNKDGSFAAYCINGHDNWLNISEYGERLKEDIIKSCCQNTNYNYLKVIKYINSLDKRFAYLTEQELATVMKGMIEE